jgi:Circadian oscillating protein COP23
MKPIVAAQILLTCLTSSLALLAPEIAQAQLPMIINTEQPDNSSQEPPDNSQATASESSLKVSCQDLKTVVQKGDREAVMLTWNYDGFGEKFTPEKRCQIVSERLQQVANRNGGTFKDLQLAGGTLNSQVVICALQPKINKCNNQNLLFTLKPENARNPDAVIEKVFGFAQDGSGVVEESSSSKPKVGKNLGKWEQQAFSRPSKSSATKRPNSNTGF